jgi:hypothetical protein
MKRDRPTTEIPGFNNYRKKYMKSHPGSWLWQQMISAEGYRSSGDFGIRIPCPSKHDPSKQYQYMAHVGNLAKRERLGYVKKVVFMAEKAAVLLMAPTKCCICDKPCKATPERHKLEKLSLNSNLLLLPIPLEPGQSICNKCLINVNVERLRR